MCFGRDSQLNIILATWKESDLCSGLVAMDGGPLWPRTKDLHSHLCFWQTLLFKVNYIAFKLYVLGVYAFPASQTCDLDCASIIQSSWATGMLFFMKLCLYLTRSYVALYHVVGFSVLLTAVVFAWKLASCSFIWVNTTHIIFSSNVLFLALFDI